jgi:hypothetical protein
MEEDLRADLSQWVAASTASQEEEFKLYPWRRYRTDAEQEALVRQIEREEMVEWILYGLVFVAVISLFVWVLPAEIWVLAGALLFARIFLSN